MERASSAHKSSYKAPIIRGLAYETKIPFDLLEQATLKLSPSTEIV